MLSGSTTKEMGEVSMRKSVFALSLLILSQVAIAEIKVIYGEDNRIEPAYADKIFATLAKSTAAMIPNYKFKELNSEQYIFEGSTLADSGVCESEPFANQPAAANCSGFLVSENTLVTAGHCMTSQSKCSSYSWVFDYKVDASSDSEVVVDKSSVYKCKSIVSQNLDSVTMNDYAVIELEKVVTDREPLTLRSGGKPVVGDELVVIGHPSGLPTKVADGGVVRSVNDVYLVASLDTYGGNSGSAVFNATDGVVEGILVRGATDYVYDSSKGCRVSNVMGQSEGRGEDVTLISSVEGLPEVIEELPLVEEEVAQDENEEEEADPTVHEVGTVSWIEAILAWLRAT